MNENFDICERFAENVFTEDEMRKRLSKETYGKFIKCREEKIPLEFSVADEIAKAMKEWAMEKGATHYTHWFQPMTGFTAEKHDGFIDTDGNGGAILKFGGKSLVKGEPDASSFPNGGLRATFEARGYTAWDPSSNAFVMNGSLYIPTVFFSYGGESLDKKAPLLKSSEAINKQALRIIKLFGGNAKRVQSMVGAEQEYFLIDKSVYEKRLDLATCGRTLFGAKPPKGQELEDHYFGKIKSRVWKYMGDLDRELWKLGIYAKTKHNEVAPAQHELASVYTPANIAVDHNQITMSVMKTVANKHDMVCLLHEKPFDGVNGSGKHNNWSLATDTGVNLFEPGDTPAENAQFLTFFLAVVAAVDDYQDLLRIAAASASNDHRLGANEAPPAVVSMFIGEELEAVLTAIENGVTYTGKDAGEISVGSTMLPHIPKDKTDRNRTSPFAFTGNKFEFRMVGSSLSIADANTIINSIVADKLMEIADVLEGGKDFKTDLNNLIKRLISKHKRIIFNGNNYSAEWLEEAKRRGLLNLPTTVDALPYLVREKNVEMFKRQGVFTDSELKSRCEIRFENYVKTTDIEAKTAIRMAKREILPSVVAAESDLAKEIEAKKAAGQTAKFETDILKKITASGDGLYYAIEKLEEDMKNAPSGEEYEAALYRKETIIEDLRTARKYADELEENIGKKYWAFPTYEEVLNSVNY